MVTSAAHRLPRVLHLEDNPQDAELVQFSLMQDGFLCELETVSTREGFVAALEGGGPDIILSDFALPTFDGLSALTIARKRVPNVPFIFVSGTIGEDAAIDSLKAGATDYVLKHRLSKLTHVVRRAVAESQELAKRRSAEEALEERESQLQQAQKLEALGRLAGGIVHDFNSLLTAILRYSQLMRSRFRIDDPARQETDEIEKAALKAAVLTRQLLAFSRNQVLRPKLLDLNVLVTKLEPSLRKLLGTGFVLGVVPGKNMGAVMADPGQMERVLMTLVANARDAMPEGGNLLIEMAGVQIDELEDDDSGPRPKSGSYVRLSVTDTGTGMTPETRSRIFEPFFSTKELGHGTGLGLATVHGIVQQSGGFIEVRSVLGTGTTFDITLPRSQAVAVAA